MLAISRTLSCASARVSSLACLSVRVQAVPLLQAQQPSADDVLARALLSDFGDFGFVGGGRGGALGRKGVGRKRVGGQEGDAGAGGDREEGGGVEARRWSGLVVVGGGGRAGVSPRLSLARLAWGVSSKVLVRERACVRGMEEVGQGGRRLNVMVRLW